MAAAFEGWAVLELLGHRIRYGQVSEVSLFGEPFCRIDIPSEPPAVEFYAGKSIYGLRPASEDAIRAYHAPRRALAAAPDPVDDGEDGDDIETCGSCGKGLAGGPDNVPVQVGEDDVEIWCASCAADDAQ